ncbi:MAG: NnrU family protein [Pseudomonadales bacterium]
MLAMTIAGLLFLVTHLGVSSTPLRGVLVRRLGEGGYLGAYSLMAAITLGLMIWMYANLPRLPYLWLPSPTLYLVPKVIMFLSFMLIGGSFLARNPSAVGMGGMLEAPNAPSQLAQGVNRITRHPLQWGIALWAGSHLAANGDAVSVAFFAAFLLLALLGSALIDRKKAATLGVPWQAFAAVTSNLPFAAIVSGRNQLVLRELLAPLLAAIVLYGAAFYGHIFIAGVPLA